MLQGNDNLVNAKLRLGSPQLDPCEQDRLRAGQSSDEKPVVPLDDDGWEELDLGRRGFVAQAGQTSPLGCLPSPQLQHRLVPVQSRTLSLDGEGDRQGGETAQIGVVYGSARAISACARDVLGYGGIVVVNDKAVVDHAGGCARGTPPIKNSSSVAAVQISLGFKCGLGERVGLETYQYRT